MVLKTNVLDLIGDTTLMDISWVLEGLNVKLYAKLEYENPTFSIKDRMTKYLIENALENKTLTPGQTVVSASSGNTAASVAMVCAVKGYKCHIITNTKCSEEKKNLARAYGATVEVVPEAPSSDPNNYTNVEYRMAKEPKYFALSQYDSLLNSETYYKTLGPEIWRDLDGKVDHIVCSASTGGTVTGLGRYFKEKRGNDVKITCVDPNGSALYDIFKKSKEPNRGPKSVIEGVGKDIQPGAMSMENIDEYIKVDDDSALNACKMMASAGILCGGSAGLILAGAMKIASSVKPGTSMVVIFPDSGFKYVSKIDFANGKPRDQI